MSGIDTTATAAPTAPIDERPLVSLAVHALPPASGARGLSATARGRLSMLAVLAVCALPVVASYVAYFLVRPESRSNYAELIAPPRELPSALPLASLDGRPAAPTSLLGQWLVVVVADGACDARCERHLWLQRQLHETLGREKERVDKVWLVTGTVAPAAAVLRGVGDRATVLRVDAGGLGRWLAPADGRSLAEHLYLVDPQGAWMMRTPVDPDPARFKRDVDRLLRASASWDRPGR